MLIFHIVCGVGGEARQLKLYSCLACVQKRQRCSFVPELLSIIVDYSFQSVHCLTLYNGVSIRRTVDHKILTL